MEEVKCPCCGQMADAAIFEPPSPRLPVVICPKCGEDNPGEAIMCWACYAQLKPEAAQPQSEPVFENRWDLSVVIGFGLAILFFISSGWVPRRWALYGVTAGVLSAVVPFTAREWHYKREAQLRQARQDAYFVPPASGVWSLDSPGPAEDIPPIIRIARTVLLYCLKDGGEIIRISAYPKGVLVEYCIAGAWHDQMRIPRYIWEELRSFMRIMAGVKNSDTNRGEMRLELEGAVWDFEFVEEVEGEETRLIFTRREQEAPQVLAA